LTQAVQVLGHEERLYLLLVLVLTLELGLFLSSPSYREVE
jgi:hypothetical protein